MDAHALECFVTIVDQGTFTKAADILHLTQPAVSAQIRRLERMTGHRLLERSAQGAVPTPAGRELLPAAREALAALDRARHALDAFGLELTGVLRLGSIPSVTTLDLPGAVAALTAEHPRLTVRLTEGPIAELTRQVAGGALDAAIIALPANAPAGVQVKPLTRSRLHVHLPPNHKLATGRSLSLRRLAETDFATLPPGTATRTALDRAFARIGVEPRIVFEAGDPARVLAFTRAAGHPAVVPGVATEPGLTAVELTRPSIESGIALATRDSSAEHPAADAFSRLLTSTAVRGS